MSINTNTPPQTGAIRVNVWLMDFQRALQTVCYGLILRANRDQQSSLFQYRHGTIT